MDSLAKFLVLFCVLGITYANDECPCTLEDSVKYPDTFVWNCFGLNLTSVPGQCYDIQSEKVSEMILTENKITSVRTIDLAGLFDLKELYIDTNKIEYFDPTALDGIDGLEVFNADHNPDMQIPSSSLRGKTELKELDFVGSKIINLPNIKASTKLEILDARSCDMSTLSRPLFGALEGDEDFLLNLVGNNIVDIAADIFLPVPANATINVDNYVIIWAKDAAEQQDVLNKDWLINLDLDVSLKICAVDGLPIDATMC